MRRFFRWLLLILCIGYVGLAILWPAGLWSLVVVAPLVVLGLYDYLQTSHAVLRNFPVLGHFRYLLELIRPEINQYFIENNTDGVPFSREQRSVVYQRAKNELSTLPFGTQRNVYQPGYEWVNHSLAPKLVDPKNLRVKVGGPHCKQPYLASVLNVSAMSYGALSMNAVQALNYGAAKGGFYHNTGEGGLSPHHLAGNGDLIYQIGTGYFGCRNSQGGFDAEKFQKLAVLPQVKMIEVKLSQGAKPGHGGILPKRKLTREIAEIRGVPMGFDVISPPAHTAFDSPKGLIEFMARLRELSGGKPVGFKLCLGKRREFVSICKAMLETGITPDFITVDGGEGGTGAAPLEFANSVGTPLKEGLQFVHNCLVGFGLRDSIRVICSGKTISGFDILTRLSLGADICNSARGMLLSLGCIQALRCNSNNCPVGITTNDPDLVAGLDVPKKAQRVFQFHQETLHVVSEILGAMGLATTSELRPWHVMRRMEDNSVKNYSEIFEYVNAGDFLGAKVPAAFDRVLRSASADSFAAVEPGPVDEVATGTKAANRPRSA